MRATNDPNSAVFIISSERGRGMSTATVSAMRPGRGVITSTRSARNTASGIECVMNTTVLRRSSQMRVGGVVGGESTGCTAAITNVYIEAALFDPLRTAATGRKLQLQSDARYRFERGLDPEFVRPGMEIATRLIMALCGGEPSDVGISGAVPKWQRTYTFRPSRVRTLGGIDVPAAESKRILEALGCRVTEQAGVFAVEPPSWRGDIECEADLVEEVLRIYGYDRIPSAPLT